MTDDLDSSKSGTFGEIPEYSLKGVSDISDEFLHAVWNDEAIKDLNFLVLNLADLAPVFKKEDSTLLNNYTNQPFANYFQAF